MSKAGYCPVVHTGLNLVLIGLLIALILVILGALAVNELQIRRGSE